MSTSASRGDAEMALDADAHGQDAALEHTESLVTDYKATYRSWK